MAAADPGCAAVRPLDAADLGFAAALHAEALPDGFFVSLGPAFLMSYYAAFMESPHAVALVAMVADEPQGVLVGTVDDSGHYRWVLRHQRKALALAAVRALVSDPLLGARFLRTRSRRYVRGALRLLRRRRRGAGATTAAPTTGALTHVAVSQASRENGVGTTLVQAYVDSAYAHGSRRLRVATRADRGTSDFYRGLGWSPAGTTRNLDGIEFEILTLER